MGAGLNIAFYHDHGGLADAWMLALAVEHAARVHPDARIFHLTTPSGPLTPASAERIECLHKGEFAERRCFAHGMLLQHLKEPVLFLDTDCHILAPVHEIWEEDFDVAVAWMQAPVHPTLPSNSGVVYTRSAQFWWDLADLNAGIVWAPGAQSWVKLEYNFNRLLARPKYRVHWLAGSQYNRIPEAVDDVPLGTRIVHWKGYRKAWVAPT